MPDTRDPTNTYRNGKRLNAGELAAWIYELKQNRLTLTEIAEIVQFKHRGNVSRYLKMALEWGLDQKRQNGAQIENTPFDKNPAIVEWRQSMMTRKGGAPVKHASSHYRHMRVLCETLKLNPSSLLVGSSNEILKAGTAAVEAFTQRYAAHDTILERYEAKSLEATAKAYSQPLRDFLHTHGYSYPPRMSGVMSGRKISHGLYADLAISKPKYHELQKLIVDEHGGYDSDVIRMLTLGVECLCRASATHTTKNTWRELFVNNKALLSNDIYEPKTKTTFTRYVFSEIGMLVMRDAKGEYAIRERNDNRSHKQAYPKLRKAFKDLNMSYVPKGAEAKGDYFQTHPSHALRHVGTQLWLLMTDWNLALVASMGWKGTAELEASYGQPPADIKAKMIRGINFE